MNILDYLIGNTDRHPENWGFLLANSDDNLLAFFEKLEFTWANHRCFLSSAVRKLKMYYVTGGMPKSVLMWTEARDVSAMQEALSGIIGAYERDFSL